MQANSDQSPIHNHRQAPFEEFPDYVDGILLSSIVQTTMVSAMDPRVTRASLAYRRLPLDV